MIFCWFLPRNFLPLLKAPIHYGIVVRPPFSYHRVFLVFRLVLHYVKLPVPLWCIAWQSYHYFSTIGFSTFLCFFIFLFFLFKYFLITLKIVFMFIITWNTLIIKILIPNFFIFFICLEVSDEGSTLQLFLKTFTQTCLENFRLKIIFLRIYFVHMIKKF